MNSTRAVKDGAVFRRPSCGGGAGPRDAEPASPGTEADSRRAGTGAPGTETGCRLCARRCGADRSAGPGFCGETAVVRAARAALHMWEEPCISGENGSGGNAGIGAWIGFILIVVIGHTLNIAMCALGAFVHPLRLNFLEFFKNSGYEAAGRKYNPLSK